MGIDKIKLGPRSRFLEAEEKKQKAAEEELLAKANDDLHYGDPEPEMVAMHPPLPGPANPTSLRGCGCGRFHIPHDAPEAGIEVAPGEVHRYSHSCYFQIGEENRVYYKVKEKLPSLEDRVKALEVVVAKLSEILDAQDAQDGEDVRADLAFDAAREDRIFGRHR